MKLNLKQKMGKELAKRLAKQISREDFLEQLLDFWMEALSQKQGAIDFDREVEGAEKRFRKTGYWPVFESAGITKEDIADTLKLAIERLGKSLKSESEISAQELIDTPTEKIGRNEPCPCGSGKKYKRCCLEGER